MRNISERAKLPFEAIDVSGLGASQSLEGDNFVHLEIVRFIHDPHATGPETTTQDETVGAAKLFGGFNHVGNSTIGP